MYVQNPFKHLRMMGEEKVCEEEAAPPHLLAHRPDGRGEVVLNVEDGLGLLSPSHHDHVTVAVVFGLLPPSRHDHVTVAVVFGLLPRSRHDHVAVAVVFGLFRSLDAVVRCFFRL